MPSYLSFICLILEFNIKFLSHSFPSLDGKNKPTDTQNKITENHCKKMIKGTISLTCSLGPAVFSSLYYTKKRLRLHSCNFQVSGPYLIQALCSADLSEAQNLPTNRLPRKFPQNHTQHPPPSPSVHSLWIHTVLLFLQKVLSGISLSRDASSPFPVLPFHWYL